MQEPKYTPGPWQAELSGDRKRWGISGNADYYINLDCKVDRDDKDNDTADANARLIKAAPDADRILRVLMDFLEGGMGISFDALMPEDGYDGAPDDQTLAHAIRAYIAKVD